MKKYVKPELVFESFEMSQQIAACDFDSKGSATDERCNFEGYDAEFGLIKILLDENNGCDWEAESYCYHGSTGEMYSIFNS